MESYNTNYIVKIVGGDSEGRKPGMLLFMGSQRVGHEVTEQQQQHILSQETKRNKLL